MKAGRIAAVVTVVAAWLVGPAAASACSPMFNPTIAALGPQQVVVVGRVGEKVPGGRVFYVERWFNGGEPMTPIVIAFKEGEPIGDCSYPVARGEHKIIAPFLEPTGTLYADFGTLQADPASEDGRRLVAEAVALFGPGVVPVPTAPPEPLDEGIPIWAIVATAVSAAGAVVLLVRRGRAPRTTTAPS